MTPEELKKRADKNYPKNYPKNYKIDKRDLTGLKGLTIINAKKLWWDERPRFVLQISINNSKNEISDFLDSMPNDFETTFFDNFYDSRPEHGAVVMFRKDGLGFQYMYGSHGWSTKWDIISKTDLIDYIYKNREYNHDKMEIYRKP